MHKLKWCTLLFKTWSSSFPTKNNNSSNESNNANRMKYNHNNNNKISKIIGLVQIPNNATPITLYNIGICIIPTVYRKNTMPDLSVLLQPWSSDWCPVSFFILYMPMKTITTTQPIHSHCSAKWKGVDLQKFNTR